ncbi:MAG: histidine kinase [Gracilimonas sp.]
MSDYLAFCGLFVLAGLLSNAYAQQPIPPMSLQEIRNDIEQLQSPEEKLRKYVESSTRYLRRTPDSMLVIAEEIQKLDGINPKEKEAFSLFVLADAWRHMNPDSAVYYAEKASEKLKELGEHNSYISVENLRATQHSREGEYVEAERLYINTISYIEALDEEETNYPVHQIYGNLGNLYSRVGAHDLAIEMFEKFLESESSPSGRCNILMRLSSSFIELGEFEKAKEILSPCLEIESLMPSIKASIRSNLSKVYENLGENNISLSLMEDAAEISSKFRIPNVGINHIAELGNKYLKLNFIQKADSVQNVLRSNSNSRTTPQQQIINNLFFADLAYAKKEYDEAISYSDAAIRIAEVNNIQHQLRNVHEIKAHAYEGLGSFDMALDQYKKQYQFDKQRYDDDAERKMAMMNVRYQLQNKDEELLSVSNQLRITQFRNIAIVLLLILIAFFVIYRYRIFYLLKEEKTRTRIARDLHDDLSGTLSSISFFSEAAQRVQSNAVQSKRFLGMIDKSASEAKEKINDIIWAIDPAKDNWSVFLKKCKRYAADAFDCKEVDYKLKLDDDFSFPVELEFRQNLWLIYKETINNLVSHSKATQAFIEMKESGGKVILEVKDNGRGFNVNGNFNGNGLKNIKDRTDTLNGKVKLESTRGEGTQWHFEFPYK